MQVLCKFYENVDKHIMKHFVIMVEKRVPRQQIKKLCHGNISVLVAHGDTDAKGSVAGACKRWWGDPGNRVPMG